MADTPPDVAEGLLPVILRIPHDLSEILLQGQTIVWNNEKSKGERGM